MVLLVGIRIVRGSLLNWLFFFNIEGIYLNILITFLTLIILIIGELLCLWGLIIKVGFNMLVRARMYTSRDIGLDRGRSRKRRDAWTRKRGETTVRRRRSVLRLGNRWHCSEHRKGSHGNRVAWGVVVRRAREWYKPAGSEIREQFPDAFRRTVRRDRYVRS